MLPPAPVDPQVYREPFFSLRRPSRSVVSRFLAHLLIRLLIVSALPGQWQAVAALFPVSMLWPLVAPVERASASGDAGPETRVRGLEQEDASCVRREASQAAGTHRGYGLGYGGSAVDPTVWGNFRFPSELNADGDTVAAKNRFAFTGYLWDKETNLFFAKARFYDPEVGRFISQDSYLGQVDDPPSLHRYFYANDNPTRYIDLTGHAGFKATGVDTTAVTVDEAGNVYVGGVRATESVTVEASVDRAQAMVNDVAAATAFPNRLANDAGHFVVNTVTAGGAGGVERAIREGRANVDDPASLARAYTEGNASFLTVGGVDAYVDARAGEGKGVLASTAHAGGAAVVNALPVQEVKTFADPNASGYDKLEAVGTGAVKVFALGALAKGGAKVIEEGRSAGKAKAAPATGTLAEGIVLRYTRNPKHPREEFARQAADQAKALKGRTAGEIKRTIERVRAEGRLSEADRAARAARRADPQGAKGKAALHRADCCIGGDPTDISGFGDPRVNSSLGRQNRTLQPQVYDAVKKQPPDAKVPVRIDVEEPES